MNVKDHTCGIEYAPVVELPEEPEVPEQSEPPVEEPETPEPGAMKPTFYIEGEAGGIPFRAMIGIDTSVLLPILSAISATLKASCADVVPL